MNQTLSFIEVNYHFHRELANPDEVIHLHAPSNLFAYELLNYAKVTLVKHMNGNQEVSRDNILFRFFRSTESFFHVPVRSHRSIRQTKPNLVIVQGFIFPLQVMALRLKLGNSCVILLQHHGESPFRRKRIFQRIADKFVNGYLFTSVGNAEVWRKSGVIRSDNKCFEIPSSSTLFTRKDKKAAKELIGLKGHFNFLWVGRLDKNKDPMTVLAAFEKYIQVNKDARLYMIFQTEGLLDLIESAISNNSWLAERVILVGEIAHHELENWYNAADYFISGSHHEGGSYALTEAMACGCIPIVTSIPSAMKSIGNGSFGYHYRPGNSSELFDLLCRLKQENQLDMSLKIQEQFIQQMSPKAIAGKIMDVYSYFRLRNNRLANFFVLAGTILQLI